MKRIDMSHLTIRLFEQMKYNFLLCIFIIAS